MNEEKMPAPEGENAAAQQPEKDWRALYEQERAAFSAYRRESEDRAERTEKRRLYEGLLRRAGLAERRIPAVLRAADLDSLRLEDGRLADEPGVLRQIRREWGDLTEGWERAETPPSGGSPVTRETILGTRDPAERQRLIAENHELFGF